MAKLIAAFLAFLLAVALAAPVAEEASPLSDAKELIEKADPVENDISAPRTDGPPEEKETPVEEPTKTSETVDTNEEKLENQQEPETTAIEAENEKEKTAEETPLEAAPSKDETFDNSAANNENEMVEGNPYEGLVPVDEVIPPPEVAFVLGGLAEESNPDDMTKYQVVQGETEEGTPVLSEYLPDDAILNEQTEDTMFPIAEATVHDYPPEEIIPEADFDQHADGGMEEHASLGPDMEPDVTMDYDTPFGDSLPADNSPSPDYDYPVDSTFVGPLDYPSSYPPGFFDDPHHYDTSHDEFMAGPVMNVDLPPVDHQEEPNMEDDMHHPDMGEMNPNFENIVAGLEARYHPGPISGFGPNSHEEHHEGPEANYPVYKDQPIIPGAMLNANVPVVESIHRVDTPVPERVPMDDLSESNAMMPNEGNYDNEFVDSNAIVQVSDDNDMPSPNNYGFDLDHPVENSDTNDMPDVVIKLSINNQEASVNGRPFDMSQAKNILNFIEELISRATFSKRPMMDEMDDHFNAEPEYPAPDMPMNDFTTNRYMGPSFSPPYRLYGDNNYDNSYYPSRNDFDYNPYHPFFNPRFNRGMNPVFDNMPGNIYHGRFGFESPSRDRRFAFNPMWF